VTDPDDVLGPDTPRPAHNLLAALVEAGEATPEEAERFARMQAAQAEAAKKALLAQTTALGNPDAPITVARASSKRPPSQTRRNGSPSWAVLDR